MSWRAAALVLLALALAGCGGSRPRPSHGGGTVGPRSGAGHERGVSDDISRPQSSRYRDSNDSVPPPIDVSKIPEPVPRAEPRSLYGNKSPYTVRGKSYRVLSSARGYDERGIASFYGAKFHGYKTSSLENYDMYAFSAAHKTLPLPSYARVTNLSNGKSVIVRVNDRGPFHDNRLIDLSYAAAVKIGIWPKGTGLVEVRAIDPAHPHDDAPAAELAAQAAVPMNGAHPVIWLQVGAFADLDNADRVARRLRSARLAPVQVSDVRVNGREVRRVRIGPLDDVDQADQLTAQIERLGLPRPQVAVD
ncbi:septal ring lytic transglycosylase RlpA family protein [Frateuria sp. STR12]|uniref:septal ring lytic transglycosylase RlpA family protein n=1 Tax=Frateuria hangzhouensis TaxID=2995589 RepID=UPI002260C33E|nr:septal ring lytic transglycosylase RlpA family protein [Frateuria sp. STR12]MCX7515196.1 septal ring lytic transglycosylase RlpA family protein [Frateuria sp. STR12]